MTPAPLSDAVTRVPNRFGRSCDSDVAWPKHRILFLLAGAFTLTGTVLAARVNRWFALLPGLVGANQLLLVSTGWCPASAVLDRVLPPTYAGGVEEAAPRHG